ncbi:MAG TPA: LamG-like jellyroll fold domain-containing protein, partial [Candidatus Nitrosotalea sp.]|nr:LamG-like jellyroll fold domain-containing protein [Candidatus Nitrosotalea sp.]
MNKKIISILVFVIMLFSMASFANADIQITNMQQSDLQKQVVPIQQSGKHVSLNLEEHVDVTIDQPNGQNIQQQTTGSQKFVNLSENVSILTSNLDHNVVALLKENSDRLTTLEKIYNSERIRFNGKIITLSNLNLDLLTNDLNGILKNSVSSVTNEIDKSIVSIFSKPGVTKAFDHIDMQLWATGSALHVISIDMSKHVDDVSHLVASSTPIILILMVPLSGYILLRSEEEKIKLNKNQIFSFCFILILVSSSAITPFAISQNYWGMAFAEPQNQTSVSDTTQNGTTNHVSSNGNAQIISSSNETNSTISYNGTVNYNLPISDSNSTMPENQTSQTLPNYLSYDVSTDLSMTDSITMLRNGTVPPVNSNTPLSTDLSMTDSITMLRNGTVPPVNSTSGLSTNVSLVDSINVTKIGITVPHAEKSWNFTSINNTTGKVRTENNTLNLQGNGYLKETVNSANTLNNFTVSAWVKPDYSQGSPIFAVITKAGQFALDVNNNITPGKSATFSIFDGIRWNTVNSTLPIYENNWTYLAGTYNGTYITIYVNGTMQSSYKLQGTLSISDDGHLVPVNPDHISSDSDVVIGASVNTIHSAVTDKFSGGIQKVNLYKTMLSPAQISLAYEQDIAALTPPKNVESSLLDGISMSDNVISSRQNSSMPIMLDALGISENLTVSIINSTLNTTSLAVTPSINATQKSYSITDSPDFQYQYFTDSQMHKLTKTIKSSAKKSQVDSWQDSEKTISVDVIGPDGKTVSAKSMINEMRQGKYDIKVSPERSVHPGIYTIKVTMIKDGKKFVTTSQYSWGLVSLNTNKSIYKPGETANFTIVVLNSTGNSVCNSDISMTIKGPQSSITTLSSGNGIVPQSQCGLYSANYTVNAEGNYTVDISASTQTGVATFETSFLSQSAFPYDIVRDADSKIDPIDNPNYFNVTIHVKSFTGSGPVTIKESVPSVFNVTTDGSVSQVNDTKIITWNKYLQQNNTSVTYSYSVPLQYPQLYALGKAQITQQNSTFVEARNWYVAVDPATSQVDTTAGHLARSDTLAHEKSARQLVCISGTTCYDFFIDNNSYVIYEKSTDGGTNWGLATVIDNSNTNVGVSIWYDQWTPGDTSGNIIHVAWIESGTDSIWYTEFNTSTDTFPTPVRTSYHATSGEVGSLATANDITITKGTDGSMYVGTADSSAAKAGESFLKRCDSSCTTASNWHNIPQLWDSSNTDTTRLNKYDEDSVVLLPLTGGNIMIVRDNNTGSGTTHGLSWDVYQKATNDTLNGNGNFQNLDQSWTTSNSYRHTLSGAVDPTNGVIYISYVPNASVASTSEVRAWKYDGTWTQLTNPRSAQSGKIFLDSSIGVSTSTKGLFVVYTMGTSTTSQNIYYATSLDGGNTWINDQQVNDGGTVGNANFLSLTMEPSSSTALHVMWQQKVSASVVKIWHDVIALLKGVTESESITESIKKKPTKSLTDSASMTDIISVKATKKLSLSDSVSITVTIGLSRKLSLSDSISMSEFFARRSIKSLFTSDSVSITDSIAKSSTKKQSLSDSVSITDTIAKSSTKKQSLSDSVSITDSITPSANKTQSLSDNLSMTDSITPTANKTQSLSDNVSITDSIATVANKTQSLSDSVSMTDTIATVANKTQSLSD